MGSCQNLLGEGHIEGGARFFSCCPSAAYVPHTQQIFEWLVDGRRFALINCGKKNGEPKKTYRRSECFPNSIIVREVSPSSN
jgi:hypothetical protein